MLIGKSLVFLYFPAHRTSLVSNFLLQSDCCRLLQTNQTKFLSTELGTVAAQIILKKAFHSLGCMNVAAKEIKNDH